MTHYIYRIEIQKPTGIINFLKSTESPIVRHKAEINNTHRSATELFNDHTEVISFIKTIDVSDQNLIHTYYELAREFKTSLEYQVGDWVYLIPKRHPQRPFRMAHRNPVLPSYDLEKPIKFYKVSKKNEWEEEKRKEKEEFYSSYWYSYFFEILGKLTAREHHPTATLTLILKAFVITLNHFYLETRLSDLENEKFFYLTTINESCYFSTIEKFYCAGAQTFTTYIKPLMEAEEVFNSQFFALIPDYLLVSCFCEFYAAAQEWERRKLWLT